MRHTGRNRRDDFTFGVFIPRPEDIDQDEFCNVIDHWLDEHGIIFQRMTEALANIVNERPITTGQSRFWKKVINDLRALNAQRVKIVHGH